MPLDSDTPNADSQLHVEFYISNDPDWRGREFVRIMAPGDKLNIVEQPVREDHKARFPREWLYFQMRNGGSADVPVIGTPVLQWAEEAPTDLSQNQVTELAVLKFMTVEQVAQASDTQVQRIGMGGHGLRERARLYLQRKHRSESQKELDETKAQLAQLQEQMAQLLAQRGPGRPRKNPEE